MAPAAPGRVARAASRIAALAAHRPLRGREAALALAALALLGALAFGPHVGSGGLYSDDWGTAAVYELSPEPRYENAVEAQRAILGGRPLLAPLQPLPFVAFGTDPAPHLALILAIGILVSFGLYVVLRLLALAPLHAVTIAGLALVFPWSDATRLWPIAGLNQTAAVVYLAGAAAALRGVGTRGRAAAAWHAGALALYVVALLVYEAVAGLIVAGGLLYLVRARGACREAWPRWAADVAVCAAVVWWAREQTEGVRPTASPAEVLDDVPEFARQGLDLLAEAVTPFEIPLALPLALAAAAGARALARTGRGGTLEPGARRWALAATLSAAFAAAAWGPFLGSTLHPLDAGSNNRVNLVAALALAALVYSLCALVAIGLTGGERDRRDGGPARGSASALAVLMGLSALLGAGWSYRTRGDIVLWDRAAALQERMLDGVLAAAPRPPRGTRLYVWGYPAIVSPGIPVFAAPWDLNGALMVRWRQTHIVSLPLARGARLTCTPTGVVPLAKTMIGGVYSGGYGPRHGAPYGRALFVDAAARRSERIDGRAECERELRRVRLAPMAGDEPVAP
jgi:hypothetical protein